MSVLNFRFHESIPVVGKYFVEMSEHEYKYIE